MILPQPRVASDTCGTMSGSLLGGGAGSSVGQKNFKKKPKKQKKAYKKLIQGADANPELTKVKVNILWWEI